jgi:predicted RNase H-like HicB family nuclease
MKSKTVKGAAKSQWGITFPKALPYSGPCAIYSTYDEVVAANDLPNNDDVVRFKNASRIAKARQKLVTDRIAAEAVAFAAEFPNVENPYIEPTKENSPRVRWYDIFESLVSHGKTREAAAELTTAALDGYTPEDFDEESE